MTKGGLFKEPNTSLTQTMFARVDRIVVWWATDSKGSKKSISNIAPAYPLKLFNPLGDWHIISRRSFYEIGAMLCRGFSSRLIHKTRTE